MALQIGSSAIAAVMLGNSVVDAIYLGAANIGAGGGGGDNGDDDMPLISSAQISNGATHFDVALPSGYDKLILHLNRVTIDANDFNGLAYVVSADGGSTFLHDNANADAYTCFDSVGILTNNVFGGRLVAPRALNLEAQIFRGDGDVYFFTDCLGSVPDENSSGSNNSFHICVGVNPTATVPTSPQAMNLMRIFPAGNMDFPATGTGVFTAGSWALYGIPTPS